MRRPLALLSALLVGAGIAGPASTRSPAAAATARTPVITAPPMGWNDWNTFGCNVSAELIEQTADEFVHSGLRDAGYRYVNIDDCWSAKQRDADGRLVADPKKFPDGIKAVADYVHARGLKLGIYADAGTLTCAKYPGSLGHEDTDAQTFADWGVDLLKYDNCNNDGSPTTTRYQAMSDALAKTGRKIVFSICEWGTSKPWQWAPAMGDYWRIDGDITNAWDSVKSIGRQLMRVAGGHAGPGYPDPDMLQVGNGALTPTESRTHFGLWALYGAPLILGNDIRSMSTADRAIVTNRQVIAVDQQAAGHAVHEVSSDRARYVLARGMADGSTVVALYNESDTPAPMATTARAAGLPASAGYTVRDLWSGTTTTSTGALADQVPAHGLTLLRVTPVNRVDAAEPVTTFDAAHGPGAQEYVVGPDGVDTTATITAPKGAGKLKDVSATLELPDGWRSDSATTVRLPDVSNGDTRHVHWHVHASGTTAATATATVHYTADGHAHARVLPLKLTPAPAVPSGQTAVSELPWLHAWAGYADPQRNTGIEGQTLAVNGQTFKTGIGSHGESEIAVWLGGNCTKLTTSVGLQDGNPAGSIQGVVEGDGKRLASTDVMTSGKSARPLTVDVTGVRYLVLHTKTGGDSSYSDRVVWAGTGLTCDN